MKEVEQRLKRIISDELPVETARIVPAANFRTDLGANLFELISVIVAAEDAYQVAIPVSAMDKIRTVGDLFAFVEGKRGG